MDAGTNMVIMRNGIGILIVLYTLGAFSMPVCASAQQDQPKVKIASTQAPVYFKNEVIGYVYKGAEIFIVQETDQLYRVRVWGGKSEFYGWMKKGDVDRAVDVPAITADGMPPIVLTKEKTKRSLEEILKVPYYEKAAGSKSSSPRSTGFKATQRVTKTEKIFKKLPVTGRKKADGYADLSIYQDWLDLEGINFILDSKIKELEVLQTKADPSYFWVIKEYIGALKELREKKAANFNNLLQSAEKRRLHLM